MTCVEFMRLAQCEPHESTRAERAAFARHSVACPDCQAWFISLPTGELDPATDKMIDDMNKADWADPEYTAIRHPTYGDTDDRTAR